VSTTVPSRDTDSIPVVADPEAAASDPTLGPLPPGRLRAMILAMAIGAFAIGVTEFASMGLLPLIAADLGVTVPIAGTLISAYALGVVVGAPVIVVAASQLGRKQLLVALAGALALGNLFSALAPDFVTMTAARFLAGLPHGAFFGVATLLAARLSPPHRRARSVSQVMLGLSIATMLGVPASTALGQWVGWRSAYVAVVLLAVVCVLATIRYVPAISRSGRAASARTELSALREPQVWFGLGIGGVGFGGMFAVYSYIAEIVPGVLDLPVTAVPVILLIFGAGMTVGTLTGGRAADRSLMGTILVGLIGMTVVLAAFALFAHVRVVGIALLVALAVVSKFFGPALQTFLLDASPEGRSLAAALHHSALNIGNAVGAAVGGAVLAAGYGLLAPAWAGSLLAAGGVLIALGSVAVARRRRARAAEAGPSKDGPAGAVSIGSAAGL
jgi:MFS transporter, DHA1 family, inner membrane transport protein